MISGKPKLLIAEDEPDIRMSVHSFFGRQGFDVSSTVSGREVLVLAQSLRPDIILLDIALQDINGIEALKHLRAYDKKTRVFVITGQVCPEEEVREIFALGISGYRRKPLILTEVGKLVCQIIGYEPFARNLDCHPPEAGRPRNIHDGRDSLLQPIDMIPCTATRAEAKTEKKNASAAKGSVVHELSNLLGIIRNKCESFTLNVEDGVYQNKSLDEIVQISVFIMKEIAETVDKAANVVDRVEA